MQHIVQSLKKEKSYYSTWDIIKINFIRSLSRIHKILVQQKHTQSTTLYYAKQSLAGNTSFRNARHTSIRTTNSVRGQSHTPLPGLPVIPQMSPCRFISFCKWKVYYVFYSFHGNSASLISWAYDRAHIFFLITFTKFKAKLRLC